MEDINQLDPDLFADVFGATPHQTADMVYAWFATQVDGYEYSDRKSLVGLETYIAMLWRLSTYFQNIVISGDQVVRWRDTSLKFFDNETAKLGDAAQVVDWRRNLARSFEQLISVLPQAPTGKL
jgi:hypothetical protein